MPIVAGDIRATMTLDASKFSDGVAQAQSGLSTLEAGGNRVSNAYASVESRLGQSAAAIAASMQQAGTSSQKLLDLAGRAEYANEKVYVLNTRVDEARAALEAAQAAAKQSSDALTLLEESAAASADNLQWAREQLDSLGKSSSATSGQISLARDEVAAFEAEVADLNKQVDAQRAVNTKNQSSVKRASDRYSSLSLQLSNAEKAADRANGRFDALTQTLGGSGKGLSLASLIDDISALGSSTLTGASRSLGTIAVNAAGIGSTTAAGAIAAEGLGDALAGLVSAIKPTNLLLGGVAAAAGYGLYEFLQYASGANAARESLARFTNTAKEWAETDVTTRYEQSEGMAAFGLGEEDFSSIIKPARGWLDELLRVWSDGKAETQEIVQEMTSGFTAGTDEMRDRLASLKTTAASGGFTGDGFLAGLDTDVERLDEIDKEVEAILKKRQNGMLSDKDVEALQGLYDEREAISIKYNLEPNGNSGFDQIVQNVESALSRGGDPGQAWVDAYAAATQGISAFTDALNTEYDAQYAALQLLDDTIVGTDGLTERQRALGELQTWYNEQAAQGVTAYNDALAKAAELTDAFGKGGTFEGTSEKLQEIASLMEEFAGGKTDGTALTDALSELDQTQVVEMTSALVAMQAAAEQSGVSLDENAQAAVDAIEYIKTALGTDVFKGELKTGLDNMFGETLDNETYEVYAGLNMESLESSYKAWAEGEHADIIPTIETNALTSDLEKGLEGYKLGVDGRLLKIDPSTGELTDTGYRVDVDGNLYQIDPSTGKLSFAGYRIGVDGSLQTVDPTTGELSDTGYRFGVDGEIGEIDPETGVIADTGYRVGVDGQIQKIDPETGEITNTEYRVGVDGRVEEIDPSTGVVSDTNYRVGVNGEISLIDPTTGELSDTNYSASIPGRISSLVEAPGLEKPTIQLSGEVTVQRVNFEEGEFSNSSNPQLEFAAGDAAVNKDSGLFVASDTARNLEAVAEAVRAYNAAVSSGDTTVANANLTAAQSTMENLVSSLSAGDLEGFEELAQNIANGLELLSEGKLNTEEAERLLTVISDIQTILASDLVSNVMSDSGFSLASGLVETLSTYGWEGIDVSNLASSLQGAVDLLEPNIKDIGVSIPQGVGEGMKDTSAVEAAGQGIGDAAFTATAESVQMGSPARRLYPVGQSITQGVGEGMKDVSAITVAAAVVASSAGAALLAAAGDVAAGGQAIGDAAVGGIDGVEDEFSAAGNNAGSSFVSELRRYIRSAASAATAIGSAAYNALKASLSIHSPSRKMRELGAYTGEGYALGISDRITMAESSIRRLAGASVRAASGTTNNAYHNAININLNGATIRSDDDIRQLSRRLGRYITDANFAMT